MGNKVRVTKERSYCKTVGDFIRFARESRGMSRAELAMWTGLDINTITHWESGETSPNATSLIITADVLRISLDKLVGRDLVRYSEYGAAEEKDERLQTVPIS